MDGDDITLQNLIEICRIFYAHIGSFLRRNIWIVGNDLHLESQSPLTHSATNIAKTYYS